MDTQPVCHMITGLGTGGAERMLVRLISRNPAGQEVISLTGDGPQAGALREMGVQVHLFDLRKVSPRLAGKPFALLRLVCRMKPRKIVGWMYHGNLAASFAARLGWRVPVIWNIRHSVAELSREKPVLRAAIKLGARLSRGPERIIYNSHVAAGQHEKLGYDPGKRLVLPNGIDTEEFAPDVRVRASFRRELGLTEDHFLVGHAGRLHPMKDHQCFLQAAAGVAQKAPGVRFALVGKGLEPDSSRLLEKIKALGFTEKVHLLGERRDMARFMSGLDVLVSSSAWGEGFPNVVGEAMACGVPAVVTDVGDSSFVVGSEGCVVPPQDPEALAKALLEMHGLGPEGRSSLGKRSRQRIVDNFSLERVAAMYFKIWKA